MWRIFDHLLHSRCGECLFAGFCAPLAQHEEFKEVDEGGSVGKWLKMDYFYKRDWFNLNLILTPRSMAFFEEPGLWTIIFRNPLDTFFTSKWEMMWTSCPALSRALRIGSKKTKWLSPACGKRPKILALSKGRTRIARTMIGKVLHSWLFISEMIVSVIFMITVTE